MTTEVITNPDTVEETAPPEVTGGGGPVEETHEEAVPGTDEAGPPESVVKKRSHKAKNSEPERGTPEFAVARQATIKAHWAKNAVTS